MRMQMSYLFVIISQIMNIIFGSLPISRWDALFIDGKTQPYNLIDTDTSCYSKGFCPMFPPGGELSAFPNGEEKYQQILHNIHRMFTNCSRNTTIGKWKYNALAAGGRTEFCQSCKYCGNTKVNERRPLYWYSDANAAARFKQWDEKHCDQDWYYEPGQTAHSTCKWGLNEVVMWGSGTESVTPMDRCALLSSNLNACQFAARASSFCSDDKDRCWFETEGICGGNSCLWDPHCDPIFAKTYDYVGKGFVEGTNGVDSVYSRFTKEIYYLLPVGAHFDERITNPKQDWRDDNKHFNLMLEYFDANATQTVSLCYALYAGDITPMKVYISATMATQCAPKYYKSDEYSVVFYAYYTPHISCEPYAFICKTSLNRLVRLPEQNHYYFGTDLTDWKWSNYEGLGYDSCKEQHYYNHPIQGWTVNGGEKLTQSDIYYYHNGGSCIGCEKIQILQCLEDCVYNYDDMQMMQPCITACKGGATPSPITPTTKSPTNRPTPKPTPSPTTKSPTNKPISNTPTATPSVPPSISPITYLPSISPTVGTFSPSQSPREISNAPTASPTDDTLSPSQEPTQTGETCSQIFNWFYKWSRISEWDENKYGALYRSVSEEAFIAQHPECGDYNGDLEYYYYFYWGGLRRPDRKKLWIYMIICCGKEKTFGPNYKIPDSIPHNNEYAANGILRSKYGGNQYTNEEETWTDPNSFGPKQYIVFSIIGLLLICCCVGCIFIFKYYYNKKRDFCQQATTTTTTPRSPRSKYQKKYPSKSRRSKKRLAESIQMQGLSNFPGPKHVQIAAYGRDSTDGSTDGNNTYQSKFALVKQHDYTDGSQLHGDDGGITTSLAPPIQLMGHQIMVSNSFDASELDAVVQHLNLDESGPPPLGLPPPQTFDHDDIDDIDDIHIHTLDVEDITNAFDMDI